MKYALFEFVDEGDGTAIEVGESCWIENFTPSEIKEWDFSQTVIVRWPTGGKSYSGSTVEEFAARVIAFSEERDTERRARESERELRRKELEIQELKAKTPQQSGDSRKHLIAKRNRIDNGDSEPDCSSLGRGRRKKIAKRFSSEDEMSDGDEPSKKKKKTTKPLPLQKASSMAAALKQQMFQNPTELQGGSHNELKLVKEKLKRCQQEKEELLQSIRFVKELPRYIEAFEKLVASAERVSSLLKRQVSDVPSAPGKKFQRSEDGNPNKERNKEVTKSSGIDPHMVERCNSSDYRKFTSDLLVVVFGRVRVMVPPLRVWLASEIIIKELSEM